MDFWRFPSNEKKRSLLQVVLEFLISINRSWLEKKNFGRIERRLLRNGIFEFLNFVKIYRIKIVDLGALQASELCIVNYFEKASILWDKQHNCFLRVINFAIDIFFNKSIQFSNVTSLLTD